MGSAVVKPLTRRRGKIKSDDPVAKNANVNQVENVGNCEPHVNFKVDTLADPVSNLCKPVSVKSSHVDAGDTQPSPVVYRTEGPTQYDSDEEPYPILLAKAENTNTNVAVDVRENSRVDAVSRNSDISSKESIRYVPHLPLEPRKHPPVSIDSRRFKGISCLFKSSNTVTCPSFRTFRKNAENKANENVETTPATAVGEDEATKPEVNLEEKDVCCDARTPSPEYDVLEVVETNPRMLEKSVPSPTHSSAENHNGMCKSPHTNEELTSFQPSNPHCEIYSFVPNVTTDQIDSFVPDVITDQPDQIDSFVPNVKVEQIGSFFPDVITEKSDHKYSSVPHVITDQVDSFIPDATPDQSELIPDTVQTFVQPVVSEVSCNDQEVEDFLSNSRHLGGPQLPDRDSVLSQHGDNQMPDPSPPPRAEYGFQLIKPDERDSLSESKGELQLDRGETLSNSVYVLQGRCELNPPNPYTATVVCSINSAQPIGDCNLPNIGDTQELNLSNIADTQELNLSNIADTQELNLSNIADTQELNLSNIGDTQDYHAPSISDSQEKLDQLDIMEMKAVKYGNEEDQETNGQYGGQSEEDTMQALNSCDIGESCLPSDQGEICTLDQSQAVYEATNGAGDFAVNVHTVKDVCDHEENQHTTQEETCPSFEEIDEKRLTTEEIDEKRLSIDEVDEKRLHPDDSSSGCVSADNNDDLCDSGADEDKRVDTKEGGAAPRLSSSHNHAGDNNTPHQSHRLGPGEADEMFRYSRRCSDSNSRSSSARSSRSSKCSTCSETGLVDNLQLTRDLSSSSKSSLIKSTSDLPPSVKGSEHVITAVEVTAREGQRSRPVSARSKTPLMDNVLLCRSETQNSLSSHSSASLVRRSPCVVEETIIPLKSSSCRMELSHSARQSPRSPRPISAKSYTSQEQKPTGIRSRPVSASHTTPPVIPVPQIAGTRLPPLNLPGKKTSRPTSGKQTLSKSEVLLPNARPSSGQLSCTQFAGLSRCTPGNIRPKSCHDGKTWSRPEQFPEGSNQELDLNSVVSKLSEVSLKAELRHQGEGEHQTDNQDRDAGITEIESFDVPYEASCPFNTCLPTPGEGPPPKGVTSPSHQRLPMPSEIFCEAGDGHYLHPTERGSVHDVISPCRSRTFLSPGVSTDAMRPRSGSCAPGDTPQCMTPRSPLDGQSSPEPAEKSRDRLAECQQVQGLSMDQIGSIRQQLYEEGLKPAERDGGVAFFIPMTGEGLLPQANGATISERLTRSRKCGLNYEERLILANINRQVQLHKRKEFAVKDIKNVKGATSGSESTDRNKQDDDIDMDFDCTF
ncbi:uncharacterized protein LOC131955584 isoform X2 [Physella acuta]|uniref:uncharacterized protein LOC131955584 isoform X2 n=1 Tax=Physella acuta TaxID=109671 RepID=UPI0027DDB5D9|nr:uncharacterized protein LOC131955584 isoform X2 [Physella acuta]